MPSGPHGHGRDDVSLGFGSATIMQDITVEFPKGTITALVGPSGSGKTTFLRSLNRMNDKVRGFWKRGDDLRSTARRSTGATSTRSCCAGASGMVFQRPNPFPMSIQDNIVAGVKAHKMAKRSELRDIAETHLAEVGLWSAVADRLGDSPFRLSGGQQQLLCLARALAVEAGGPAPRRADVVARPPLDRGGRGARAPAHARA